MTIVKQTSKHIKARIGNYEVEVQDYGYKSRPPVAIRVSGTVLGECKNGFGEPCYFYKSDESRNLEAGVQLAQAIVTIAQHQVFETK